MISLRGLKKESYDVAIVGGGPGGVSAAINASVRKKEVLLVEAGNPMQKFHKAKVIPNYPGFPFAKGEELVEAFSSHLDKMGIKIKKARVLQISRRGRRFIVYTEKDTVEAKSVILAVGVISEKKIAGEEGLIGEGVSYCITCDGLVFEGEKVAVIAYSKEGEEDARTLSEEYRCEVVYIPQYKMTGKLSDSIQIANIKPRSLKAVKGLIEIDSEKEKIRVRGVFILKEDISPGAIILGLEMKKRFIKVDSQMSTNIGGVFAAGDCIGPPFQIAKAVGEGQIAALSAVKYLSGGDE
ncbi:MAG: NAD(P)/FAD-dependent oxidoreductase [Candidatus Hydrothermarchaeaceae archaeon]